MAYLQTSMDLGILLMGSNRPKLSAIGHAIYSCRWAAKFLILWFSAQETQCYYIKIYTLSLYFTIPTTVTIVEMLDPSHNLNGMLHFSMYLRAFGRVDHCI